LVPASKQGDLIGFCDRTRELFLERLPRVPSATLDFLRAIYYEHILTHEEWKSRYALLSQQRDQGTISNREFQDRVLLLGGMPMTVEDHMHAIFRFQRLGATLENCRDYANVLPDFLRDGFLGTLWTVVTEHLADEV
jgi:hypothetical protein